MRPVEWIAAYALAAIAVAAAYRIVIMMAVPG